MISTMICQLALWLTLFSWTISGDAGVGAVLEARAPPPLPSADDFYKLPDNLDSYAPGAIIRHRPPPNPIAVAGLIHSQNQYPVHLDASYQLLYRTTDSLNNATATVLTVLVPRNANFNKVLSYQAVDDASNINCAPSYAFQLDSGPSVAQGEVLLVEAALEQGWVVIVPDYLGPKGAFLANVLAGQAVLDGIRAARNSGAITGIGKNPTVTLWGYSGGSLATLFAAELQPSYAPEVAIAGAAAGGAVPNITTVLGKVDGTGAAGLIPAGILGLAHQYPEVDALIQKHVLPQHRDEFYKADKLCLLGNINEFSGKNLSQFVDDPSLLYANPTVVRIAGENDLGQHAPKAPLLMYKATKDEVSPVAETDALVDWYCKQGATVQYLRDESTNHESLAVTGAPKALAWLRGRMNGEDRQTACETKTVYSVLLDFGALAILPKVLLDAFLDVIGKRVGPFIKW
ncbi:lipase 2 [Metarhizium brunneum]